MDRKSRGPVTQWLKIGIVSLIVCASAVPCAGQCGFAIVPAAEQRWYRNEGWPIPGLSDAKGFAVIHRTVDGKPSELVLPEGISVTWAAFGQDSQFMNYHVQFPDVFFDDEGTRKHMLARSFKVYKMLRWQMKGTTYAYSYLLGASDVACMSSVDIIDDRGDGKFRLMTVPGDTYLGEAKGDPPEPPPVPDWLKKPKT